ncbi:MAG: class I SAM-dependent methyltransferase [Gemmatimonadetes bacterium]|nr:class I SAM-dependent methyltransferase [Gemmatimonadota bacterium]
MNAVSAFDALAKSYDAVFTDSVLGRVYREATWAWLDQAFEPGQQVLEIGCGTGEDAIHLAHRGVRVVATDPSAAMIEATRAKSAAAGLSGMVTALQVDAEHIGELAGKFDGAFSSFGALNLVPQMATVVDRLAERLRPQARLVLGIMGPVVPWEWAWYMLRGQPGKALRRLRRGGVEWRGMTVRYPTIGTLRRVFGHTFRFVRAGAIGAIVPPPYAEAWARRHPAVTETLVRWERAIETVPPLPWLADHYQLEFVRR